MNFSEKLKEIRRDQGLSQEQLAEKIGVSRQAITKWETGKGLPDIENMVILSEIFKTTLDELILDTVRKEKAFVSDTVYDIDCQRRFDIRLGSAKSITVSAGTDEKLHISLQSDTIEDLDQAFKVKLDPSRNRLDVNCVRSDKVSRFEAEDALSVHISLPEKFAHHVELAASVSTLELNGLHVETLEYDGDAAQVKIKGSSGSLEFTGKTDYEIWIDQIDGRLDVNQWKAKALVHISEKALPMVVNMGRKCGVVYLKDGAVVEYENAATGENQLRVSGMFSELVVDLGK